MFVVYVTELIQGSSANSRTTYGIESSQERVWVVVFLLDNPAFLENLSRNSQPCLCISDDRS